MWASEGLFRTVLRTCRATVTPIEAIERRLRVARAARRGFRSPIPSGTRSPECCGTPPWPQARRTSTFSASSMPCFVWRDVRVVVRGHVLEGAFELFQRRLTLGQLRDVVAALGVQELDDWRQVFSQKPPGG